MNRIKKLPMRKCIGCQEMKEKKCLVRVVRTDGGTFSLDKTGKKAGRGAYICPNPDCFAKARKSKGFERSFKAAIPKEVYEILEKELIQSDD